MTPQERAEVEALLAQDCAAVPWRPLPGPQMDAFSSAADVVGYGGAAGGGKSSLAVGLALTQHRKSIIYRQTGTELMGVIDEMTRVLGSRDGYNGTDRIWRHKSRDGTSRQVELGSFPNPGDEIKYQGRDHDLIVYDEASNMRKSAVLFLMGWLRSASAGQRCRVLMTFNPPTTSDGRWIIEYFAPWINPQHPNPAKPGELRWFAMVDGEENEVEGPDTFVRNGETITPRSRTFIPSRVQDNPFLAGSGYESVLQSLPEPLRSQMLRGDFGAGVHDDPWQVIPTAWVLAAQARWVKPASLPEMDSMGVDVARGGMDRTVIARRHGAWFDEPLAYPGSDTPDGPTTAGLVISARRSQAVVHIDVIGVGASPYDFLRDTGCQVLGVNVSESARGTDASGRLRFANHRSELWWRFREALDPANNRGICLPASKDLARELCAPTWRPQGSIIRVESREDIVKRLGVSPDLASAYILALLDTPKVATVKAINAHRNAGRGYDPLSVLHSR